MPESIYNEAGEKFCPTCSRYYPPTREHWYFQFGKAGAPCKNCRMAARKTRVYNEAGDQQCRRCLEFFAISTEHYYFERGRPKPYCRGCDYAMRVASIKAPTEAGMLRRFRAENLPTSELYQFLAEKYGKEIARERVDQERKALGLPAMMLAKGTHE